MDAVASLGSGHGVTAGACAWLGLSRATFHRRQRAAAADPARTEGLGGGGKVVLSAISCEALEDDAEPVQRRLSHDQLVTLASANVEAIGRVLNAKLDAGEAITPAPGDRPRVVLRCGDLRAAGEKLSASILTAPPFGWGAELAAR